MPRSILPSTLPQKGKTTLNLGDTYVGTVTLEAGAETGLPTGHPYFVMVNSGQVQLDDPLATNTDAAKTQTDPGRMFVVSGRATLKNTSVTRGASISFASLDVSVLLRLLGPTVDGAKTKFLAYHPGLQRSDAALIGAFELLVSFEKYSSVQSFSKLPFIEDFLRAVLACRPVGLSSAVIAHEGLHPSIHHLVCHIHANYHERITVPDMSKMAGMGRSSLFDLFKKETGYTPTQFLRMLRLAEAQRVLAYSSYPVAQAAYSVGYKSTSQFCRDYQAAFDHPPSAAKETILNYLQTAEDPTLGDREPTELSFFV